MQINVINSISTTDKYIINEEVLQLCGGEYYATNKNNS